MAADRAAAERSLAEFGRRYATRRARIDEQARALQDERDRAIIAAFTAGLSTRQIAATLGEISHQRVAQIVQQR